VTLNECAVLAKEKFHWVSPPLQFAVWQEKWFPRITHNKIKTLACGITKEEEEEEEGIINKIPHLYQTFEWKFDSREKLQYSHLYYLHLHYFQRNSWIFVGKFKRYLLDNVLFSEWLITISPKNTTLWELEIGISKIRGCFSSCCFCCWCCGGGDND
jgi:hypothetical protein